MATTTDYDAPRTAAEDSIEELKDRRSPPSTVATDGDENDRAAAFFLPGADVIDEELTAAVVPIQTDEFRCERCFLVWHRSQQATSRKDLCRDCS